MIIFSPYVGKDFLKLSTYMQMCGRAGRMGLTNVGESYVVCQEADMLKVRTVADARIRTFFY